MHSNVCFSSETTEKLLKREKEVTTLTSQVEALKSQTGGNFIYVISQSGFYSTTQEVRLLPLLKREQTADAVFCSIWRLLESILTQCDSTPFLNTNVSLIINGNGHFLIHLHPPALEAKVRSGEKKAEVMAREKMRLEAELESMTRKSHDASGQLVNISQELLKKERYGDAAVLISQPAPGEQSDE